MVVPVGEWAGCTKVISIYSGKGHKIKEKPRLLGHLVLKNNEQKFYPNN